MTTALYYRKRERQILGRTRGADAKNISILRPLYIVLSDDP